MSAGRVRCRRSKTLKGYPLDARSGTRGGRSMPAARTSTTMILVTVMYPAGPENSFNRGYYLETHIALVKERWRSMGLENVQLLRGIASGDGSEPVYQVIALLSFRSQQEFQKAVQAHGQEIFGDIPKFTSVQPVVQINEALG